MKRMPQLAAICLVVVMVAAGFNFGCESAAAQTGSRTAEQEPNNSYAEAKQITPGDIISGGLDYWSDPRDVFKIHATAGQIINISFIQDQYNPGNPNQYRMDFELISPDPYRALIWTWHRARQTEAYSALAIETGDYYLWLYIWSSASDPDNDHSSPVTYNASANVTTLSPISAADDPTGFIDTVSGTDYDDWYLLSTSPDKGIQLTLNVPANGDFDVYLLNMWPRLPNFEKGHKNPLWLNASYENATGNFEFVKGLAIEGKYYIKVRGYSGTGSYTLDIAEILAEDDGHSTPANANVITKREVVIGSLHQSEDHFDWYKFRLDQGQSVDVIFELLTNTGDQYNLSMYDSNEDYITGAFDTANGGPYNSTNTIDGTADITGFVAPSNGDYYVMVMPVRPMSESGGNWRPCVSNYKITFELPNKGPSNNKDLPVIQFEEDTVYTGLDLNNYFLDEEGDTLEFDVEQAPGNMTIDIDPATGIVTITPVTNYNTGTGTVSVTFNATDPGTNIGPATDSATTTIKIDPVNDPPVVKMIVEDFSMAEDGLYVLPRTIDEIFFDVDGDVLEYRAENNTHIPVDFDTDTGNITLGPVEMWYGMEIVSLVAKDAGNIEVLTNVTVSVFHENHPPVLNGSDTVSLVIDEDEVDESLNVTEWFTDKDPIYAGDTLTYKLGLPPPENVLAEILDTKLLRIKPVANWSGEETVTVICEDSKKEKATVTVEITVNAVNDPPVIVQWTPMEPLVTVNEGMNASFKIIKVDDSDTDPANITYTWYIDDKSQSTEGPEFNMSTDYDLETPIASAGEHTVKVEVRDGEFVATWQWNVTVKNTNQAPTGVKILKPEINSTFKKGKPIDFEAAVASDIDGDNLTYTWKLKENDQVLGENRTFTFENNLKKGKHTIVLEVSDGTRTVKDEVEIEIKAKSQDGPGFELLPLLLAGMLAMLLYYRRRRR